MVSEGVNKWWTYIAELIAVGTETSISETNIADSNVFPNPAINYLSIYINIDKNTPANFLLFDMNGRLVRLNINGYITLGT